MKQILVLLVVAFALPSFASDYSAGVMVGSSVALSGKYQLSDNNQINAAVGNGHVGADYLWVDKRNFDVSGLSWQYGAGAFVEDGFGIRAVGGAEYKIGSTPFDAFGFLAIPLMAGNGLNIAVGARYNF